MENLRPQMDKTRRVQQYYIVFSETEIVTGNLNKALSIKRLALT